jgi:DNA-binding transcriptional LysR family regulator
MEHRRRYPDVDVHTVDGPRDRLLCDLSGKAIDVVIMTSCGPAWDDRMLPLWSERVIVALPDQHTLATRPAVRWCELANERLLLPQRDPGPEFEHLVMTKLRCAGLPRILHQEVGLDRLLSLVSAGYGAL